jgi:N-acetylglutamate synthase/N-acetylornithine aminotransferase
MPPGQTCINVLYTICFLQVTIGGKQVHIGGMCKGSGMIHPNMATMLGVVTCDADVEPEVWRGMLRRACDASFNAVSEEASFRCAKLLMIVCRRCSQ